MIAALIENPTFAILATGALAGIGASLVGCFLVLRGNSMLSDAISHSVVFGIVLVWLATGQKAGPVQIVGAALTGLLTVFLTETLARTRRVHDDAAIGLVFPVLFSLGVILINLFARDIHIDEHTVLLGEIGFVWLDTVTLAGVAVPQALLSTGAMAALNLLFVALFFKELKLSTFDPLLAKALGFLPALLSYALLALTSATAVAAFDAVGAILFIAFVIVPASAAYLLTDRLGVMLALSCLIALLSSLLGYPLAVWLNVSIGGTMAAMTGVFLALAFLLGPRHGLIARRRDWRDRRAGDETRTLAVHLFNHEGEPEEGRENNAGALREHLRWDEAKVARVLARSLDRGLVTRQGERLRLTDKGRAVAREIMEPWRRDAAPEAF